MSGPPSLKLQITSDYEETSYVLGTPGAIFRPKVSGNTFFLGDHAQAQALDSGPVGSTVVVVEGEELLAPPRDYTRMWTSISGGGRFSIWAPLAPSGYVSLGCVAEADMNKPRTDRLRCVRWDVVREVQPGPFIFYTEASGSTSSAVTIYSVPGLGTFQAQNSLPEDATFDGLEFKATPPSVQTWVPKNL
jgi:hypothetical protein